MPLHICLDARLVPGVSGGIEQVAAGLMHALAAAPSDRRYSFLVYNEFEAHFRTFAGSRVELVPVGPAPLGTKLPRWARVAAPLANRTLRLLGLRRDRLPAEPPVVERLAPDVIHFNFQGAFLTARRNLYQPWDLQHLHLPQFFTRAESASRDRVYRAFCRQATLVVVASAWGRDDIASAYGIPKERIRVVPMASPTDAYPVLSDAEVAAELATLGLEAPYAYFPAQSWPHKNHLALIRALHLLRRDKGTSIRLVLSGRQTEHYPTIIAEADRLGVTDLVRHVGFVSERQMVALYRGARLLTFPSLFEGWGLPITEAMTLGVPIAASQATCIPEQLGDAGLLFDPQQPAEIADRMLTLWSDPAARERCVARGRDRVKLFTWERVAETLNRIYAEVAAP